jgi:hypothetical protein
MGAPLPEERETRSEERVRRGEKRMGLNALVVSHSSRLIARITSLLVQPHIHQIVTLEVA